MTPHDATSPPESPTALFTQGRQAEKAGQFDQAHDLYSQAIAADASHGDWFYRLGCVYLKTERFEKALGCFEDGLQRSPGNARMLTNLGVAFDQLGRRDEAVSAYQRAAYHDDAPAAALHNLGALYAEEGRAEDAIRAFREAVKKAPDAEGYCSLGMALLGRRDLVRALEAFEQCVACDRGFTRGHYYAGICLLKRGRYRDALARFDLVLKQEPGLVRAHLHRGICLHNLEQYQAALAALSEAETAFPEDGRVHFQLAITCDALGLATEARRHYHQARVLREDPREGDVPV